MLSHDPSASHSSLNHGFVAHFRHSDISHESDKLIKGLLQLNPKQRLTATQVREQLETILERELPIPWERTVPGTHNSYSTATAVDPVQVTKSVRSRLYKVKTEFLNLESSALTREEHLSK